MTERPIAPTEVGAALELLVAQLKGTAYLERAKEALALAGGDDPEYRAIVCGADGKVVGLALFGEIAGAESGHRIFAIAAAADDDRVGDRLMEGVVRVVRAIRGRYLLAELPDDPALAWTVATLRRNGFVASGQIPDYYREGVPLTILRRDFASPPA